MKELDSAIADYIAAIKATQVYQEYVRQKERVRQFPDLKEQIDTFRRRNYELQMSADNDFNRIDSFEKEYEDFRENPVVADFLAAELAFCRMMQKADLAIVEAMEFE